MARTSTRQPANSQPVSGPLRQGGPLPYALYVRAPGMDVRETQMLAIQAAAQARALSPKLSGQAAAGIKPFFGPGYFGVKWDRPYLAYQEFGIGSFTMTRLAGKTIPMWIDDPTGSERRNNPNLQTRVTESGRLQVLIFRKAARIGQRKRVAVRDGQGRLVRWREVPASYPGAPGRIVTRGFNERRSLTTGRIAKLVSRPHMGVRWRHPGLVGREFMQYSVQQTAAYAGIRRLQVYAVYRRR